MSNFSLHLRVLQFDPEGFKKGFSYIDESFYNTNSRNTSTWHSVYQITLKQENLGLNKTLKDKNLLILTNKAQAVIDKWAILWNQQYTGGTIGKSIKERNDELENILQLTLNIDDTVNFDLLKNNTPFEDTDTYASLAEKINQLPLPVLPDEPVLPPKPEYIEPIASFWQKMTGKGNSMKAEYQNNYNQAIKDWELQIRQINDGYESEKQHYNNLLADIGNQRKSIEKTIETEKVKYLEKVAETKKEIDALMQAYQIREPYAIEEYCEIVLNNSIYPDYFPKEFELEYNPDNSLLIVNYFIPEPELLPKEKDVKFSTTKNEATSIFFSEKDLSERYNRVVYMIIIRTIHEIFESDSINAIDFVCINGFINHLNKATGNKELKCIATISTSKEEFNSLNLAQINPEACFKQLKGIAAKKLIDLTPVAPIIKMDKSDSMFIDAKDVLHAVDDSVNLAAMDWEDFEHLIREIFGKEFSQYGGEVKVTQSSRDGGVDAIVFDPDPIRGGKIIIQAKRYANVVGVSAVRDLFGTVMNEGANKGIIVTTSYFGKDAYDFAKNKPLTLIDGSNLLYLLGKHGHKAKIDLEQAKLLGNK